MARDGVWTVQVQSDEAIQKEQKHDEGANGIGFRLRFKTGEYAKDADANESTSASLGNLWV